jgi:hypothetical protein
LSLLSNFFELALDEEILQLSHDLVDYVWFLVPLVVNLVVVAFRRCGIANAIKRQLVVALLLFDDSKYGATPPTSA